MKANDLKGGGLITGWARDMGCAPTTVTDPQVNWAFEITVPGTPIPGILPLKMTIYNPKQTPRAVIITVRVQPPPEHVAAFEALEQDEKTRFWQELRSRLSRENVECQIEGTPMVHCPAGFVANCIRYDDGLTLDSFAHNIASLQRTVFDAIAVFHEHLGDLGPAAPGGEFAFRKLGIQ